VTASSPTNENKRRRKIEFLCVDCFQRRDRKLRINVAGPQKNNSMHGLTKQNSQAAKSRS
jgi:hypothetical protein